ncbi:MAG: hypothetical protein D6715_02095 [Calditrichaeota bacterium]|nr:MAG: hypothetical protein D6715_02095 [Calditrichota bacterium]
MRRPIAQSRIVRKILLTGARITSEMLEEKAGGIPGGWGKPPTARQELWHQALPAETRSAAEPIWQIDPATLKEMFFIWKITGVLDQLALVDPILADVCNQILEEQLEEAGFKVD